MEVIYPKKFDLSSCTSSIDQVSKVLSEINQTTQLIESHTVTLLGEYTWNGYTTNIYMLSGGVPSSVQIDQFINEVCAVIQQGTEFKLVDQSTGLINVSLYDPNYVQMLVDSGQIIVIGADKYVILTSCELLINDGELGEQLADDLSTVGNTSYEAVPVSGGYLYNWFALQGVGVNSILSSDNWRLLSWNDRDVLINALGPDAGRMMLLAASWKYTGGREVNGTFVDKDFACNLWCLEQQTVNNGYSFRITSGVTALGYSLDVKEKGKSVVAVRLATAEEINLVEGSIVDEYTGNDGKKYNCYVISNLVVSEQLQETKLRNGVKIATQLGSWAGVVEPRMSVFNNEPFEIVTNGSITGVDVDGNLIVSTIDENGNLNLGVKHGELPTKNIVPVLMRKIN